ncbi:sugar porter family MFS transporter [Glutamicibacter endophyticus]|uniref:sugar porter family MFS transporter n=1 Tax=Glutamicibacter endophyticus TaxID=1522174 RepID=UPI003AF1A58B
MRPEHAQDVEDGKISGKLIGLASVAALGGFLFGYDSAIINGTVDAVQAEFGLSPVGIGFVVSCALIGAAIGAWTAGWCAQRIGRVKTMLIASALLAISAVGSALAFGSTDLIVWRFVGGIGVGFASVIAPAYIAEIAPSKHRGRMGSLQQMAVVTGIFLAFLVSTLIVSTTGGAAETGWLDMPGWRWMLLSELLPALLYGLLALRLPESPRYLVGCQRLAEASHILVHYVGIDAGARTEAKIEEIRQTLNVERRQTFGDLLGGSFIFKPIVWIGIVLSVFQQFVGINVIFYYSTTLWKSVGFDESNSFLISVITSVTNIVATVIAIALIDKIGRKTLLVAGSTVMTISLGIMALAFSQSEIVGGELVLPGNWGVTALIFANLFVIGFGTSWGPAVWVLLGEMFPNRIRAMALGVAAAAQWMANFLVSTTFPSLAEVGLQLAYGLYATFALLSLLFVLKFVRETKGKQLEEMTG